jgi:hypothetical protein
MNHSLKSVLTQYGWYSAKDLRKSRTDKTLERDGTAIGSNTDQIGIDSDRRLWPLPARPR